MAPRDLSSAWKGFNGPGDSPMVLNTSPLHLDLPKRIQDQERQGREQRRLLEGTGREGIASLVGTMGVMASATVVMALRGIESFPVDFDRSGTPEDL